MVARLVTKKLRVLIYARRSDESGDRERSIVEQVATCRRWAEERGYAVVAVVEELGSGVTGKDREKFVAMVERAERHRDFDLVVTLDVSRFGRFEPDERGYWVHRLRTAGVEVAHVLDGEALAGPAGAVVGAVLQTAANDHSRKTGYKVALAHAAQIERGHWAGGRVPYGYRPERGAGWNGDGRRDVRLVIDEEKAPLVRRIYDDFEHGRSPLQIASGLNSEKIPSPKGTPWWRTTITGILSNPAYAGDLALNQRRRGHAVLQAPKFYRATADGPAKDSTEPAAIVKRDAFPAIIKREQWDRVAAEMERRARKDRKRGRPHLLTGFTKCGCCGGPMTANGGRTTLTGRVHYYVCLRGRALSTGATRGECGRVNVRGERIESEILRVVREEAAQIDPERLRREVRRLSPRVPRVDVAALEKKRRALAAKRDEILLEDDSFTRGGLRKLAEEDARLAREIEQARAQEGKTLDLDAAITAAVEAARKLEAPDTEEGRDALRDVLKVFVKKLEVKPAPRGQPKRVVAEIYTPAAVALAPAIPTHDAMLWRLTHPRA